jgi:hypothetical protein
MRRKKEDVEIELIKIGSNFFFTSLTRQGISIESVYIGRLNDEFFLVKRRYSQKYFKSLSRALNHMNNYLKFYKFQSPYK